MDRRNQSEWKRQVYVEACEAAQRDLHAIRLNALAESGSARRSCCATYAEEASFSVARLEVRQPARVERLHLEVRSPARIRRNRSRLHAGGQRSRKFTRQCPD